MVHICQYGDLSIDLHMQSQEYSDSLEIEGI